jgi:hypothetical protein
MNCPAPPELNYLPTADLLLTRVIRELPLSYTRLLSATEKGLTHIG